MTATSFSMAVMMPRTTWPSPEWPSENDSSRSEANSSRVGFACDIETPERPRSKRGWRRVGVALSRPSFRAKGPLPLRAASARGMLAGWFCPIWVSPARRAMRLPDDPLRPRFRRRVRPRRSLVPPETPSLYPFPTCPASARRRPGAMANRRGRCRGRRGARCPRGSWHSRRCRPRPGSRRSGGVPAPPPGR